MRVWDIHPKFWQSIDPMTYLKDITAPVQIQHGTSDEEVPYVLSQKLDAALKKAGKTVEFILIQKMTTIFQTTLLLPCRGQLTFLISI